MARANASTMVDQYQQSIWGPVDPTLKKCFTGSGILGLLVLIAVFVAPALPPVVVTVDDIPDRIARLILEKPKAAAPVIKTPDVPVVEAPKVEAPPTPKAPPRRTSKPKVAKDRGAQGRQKAQADVQQNLAQVTGSLDKVLDDISKSLPASENSQNDDKPKSRRRRTRSGRSGDQLTAVSDGANLTAPDVSKSAIHSDGISISAISDLMVDGEAAPNGVGGTQASGGSQSGRSEYRSNEELLATVRRYAPGIQFCYDNELKRNPDLRGKLVVSITVLNNGRVSEVIVVQDTLKSAGVRDCVLAQIRGWQMPQIPYGTVSFKTPFVFTPPN